MDPAATTRADTAATFYTQDGPPLTRIGGIIGSAVHSAAGNWFFTFNQGLAFGEYLAGASNLTFASPVEINVYDGDATHKLLISRVGGVAADINGICAWWQRAF